MSILKYAIRRGKVTKAWYASQEAGTALCIFPEIPIRFPVPINFHIPHRGLRQYNVFVFFSFSHNWFGFHFAFSTYLFGTWTHSVSLSEASETTLCITSFIPSKTCWWKWTWFAFMNTLLLVCLAIKYKHNSSLSLAQMALSHHYLFVVGLLFTVQGSDFLTSCIIGLKRSTKAPYPLYTSFITTPNF